MKKLSVLVILLLAMCLSFGTITTVTAEELPSTEQTQETPNLPSTDDVINGSTLAEEDKELIKDLVNKVKEYTNNSDSFFVRYIVPLLVAGALCVLVSIILILPIFKNKTENKTLKSMLKNAKTQIEELKKEGENLKALINANNMQEQVKAVVKKEMANMSKMVEDTLVKGGVELDKIESVLLSLVNGALNAWKSSPEAIACLTQSASANELKNLAEKNAQLVAYVYNKFGEEASEELSKLL